MKHAERRLGEPRLLVNAQLTSQMGLLTGQEATSSWGPGMGRGNYHELLGHPRRFQFTGIRRIDYSSFETSEPKTEAYWRFGLCVCKLSSMMGSCSTFAVHDRHCSWHAELFL